jgi:phosphoglycolate phosphatase-like HAD superfamily hydrolase
MTLGASLTAADLPRLSWLDVVNPSIRLGGVRHALFDFDGTISVIRRGWEKIMIPMMVEMICGDHPPTPEIEAEVSEYVDLSTGVLTIRQMQWLEEAVRRHGFGVPKPAREYKRIYNERLLRIVHQRLGKTDGSPTARDRLMIVGSRPFLQALRERGVDLYLASGTDHQYVLKETVTLGVTHLFRDRIYGARDDSEAFTKERIIQRIMDEHALRGEELLVVGDGPVEIRNAKACRAVALGVASDEECRQGLNPRKRQRLLAAGADLIISDFLHHEELLRFMLADDGAMPPDID